MYVLTYLRALYNRLNESKFLFYFVQEISIH